MIKIVNDTGLIRYFVYNNKRFIKIEISDIIYHIHIMILQTLQVLIFV